MAKTYSLVAAAALVLSAAIAFIQPETAAQNNAVRQAIIDAKDLKLVERLPMLRAAREAQEVALQRNVVEPYAWSRLAALRRITQNNRAGELQALRVSQQAAPYEPRLMVERAFAFYALSDLHNEDDRQTMAREWRYAFYGDREKLFPLLKRYPVLVPEIERAMANDQEYAWWKSERRKAGI